MNVNSNAQKGNVREGSSNGSLEGGSRKFKKQAHFIGSVPVYVCVLDGNVSIIQTDINAATLQNRGKGHRKVFQGVTG